MLPIELKVEPLRSPKRRTSPSDDYAKKRHRPADNLAVTLAADTVGDPQWNIAQKRGETFLTPDQLRAHMVRVANIGGSRVPYAMQQALQKNLIRIASDAPPQDIPTEAFARMIRPQLPSDAASRAMAVRLMLSNDRFEPLPTMSTRESLHVLAEVWKDPLVEIDNESYHELVHSLDPAQLARSEIAALASHVARHTPVEADPDIEQKAVECLILQERALPLLARLLPRIEDSSLVARIHTIHAEYIDGTLDAGGDPTEMLRDVDPAGFSRKHFTHDFHRAQFDEHVLAYCDQSDDDSATKDPLSQYNSGTKQLVHHLINVDYDALNDAFHASALFRAEALTQNDATLRSAWLHKIRSFSPEGLIKSACRFLQGNAARFGPVEPHRLRIADQKLEAWAAAVQLALSAATTPAHRFDVDPASADAAAITLTSAVDERFASAILSAARMFEGPAAVELTHEAWSKKMQRYSQPNMVRFMRNIIACVIEHNTTDAANVGNIAAPVAKALLTFRAGWAAAIFRADNFSM